MDRFTYVDQKPLCSWKQDIQVGGNPSGGACHCSSVKAPASETRYTQQQKQCFDAHWYNLRSQLDKLWLDWISPLPYWLETAVKMQDAEVRVPTEASVEESDGHEVILQSGGSKPKVCADAEGKTCECNGRVYYGKKFNGNRTPPTNAQGTTNFEQMMAYPFVEKSVSGKVTCSNSGMGADPLKRYAKWCYCEELPSDNLDCSFL